MFCEVMSRFIVYTTEPCSFCRGAKALLDSHAIPYDEVNLSKDPVGRSALVQQTGLMTFPQITVGGKTLGGYRELIAASESGRLDELAA